jgi:hypothetical protein
MADRRRKNVNWSAADDVGSAYSKVREGALLAVLMDLRDELQLIRGVMECGHMLAIPWKLERIARNTSKPKKRRKAKKRGE